MKLFKGCEAEYQRRHDEIWPELRSLLHEKGIQDYSIFLDQATGDLFGVLKVHDAIKLEELPGEPVMKKWWDYVREMMETNDDHSPVSTTLKEVFYLP